MFRTILKSKIHRARITNANLNYEGSLSIDLKLVEAADILPYEKVDVVNINNSKRFSTYAI
jgi:aspartate 1-decarboxylase